MIVSLASKPHVVAVVPTLGGDIERLQACISSIDLTTASLGVGVVVVWNCAKEPTLELENIEFLTPGINLGFPGALAHARRRISPEFLWIMQDDVEVLDGCLEALLSELVLHKNSAITSPVALNEAGNIPAGGRAGIFDSEGRICASFPTGEVAPKNFSCPSPLGYVASSGSLVPTKVWDAVGGYDPEFFPLLWSDADFGYRAGLVGYQSVVVPSAHIRHGVHGSTPGLLSQHLMAVNGERFRKKHFAANGLGDECLAVDVDTNLLHTIVRSASTGLIEFATFATQTHKELRANALREIDSLTEIVAKRDEHIESIAEVIARRDEEIQGLTKTTVEIAAEREALAVQLASVRDTAQSDAARKEEIVSDLQHRLAAGQRELALIKGSRVWRYSKFLRQVRHYLGRIVPRIPD